MRVRVHLGRTRVGGVGRRHPGARGAGDSPRSARGGVRAEIAEEENAIERIRKRRRKKRRRERRRRRHVRVRAVRPAVRKGGDWSAVYLYRNGVKDRRNCEAFPAATAAIESLRDGCFGGGVGVLPARLPVARSGARTSRSSRPTRSSPRTAGPATRVCGARWAWTCRGEREQIRVRESVLTGSYGGSFRRAKRFRGARTATRISTRISRPRRRSSADARGHVRFSIRSCLCVCSCFDSGRSPCVWRFASSPSSRARRERSRALSFASRTRRSATRAFRASSWARTRVLSRPRAGMRVANATTAWSEGSLRFVRRLVLHSAEFRRARRRKRRTPPGTNPARSRGTASCSSWTCGTRS